MTSQATLALVVDISEIDISESDVSRWGRPDAPNPIPMRHLARICPI